MNENIYYLSIQSTSLAHYVGRGLILPSRFYTNRPADIQNIQSDYLVLSKNKFLNDSNCSIEIILENTEIKKIVSIVDTSISLYPEPIPISRIKKVYFIDKIQKLKTIDTINRGAGFISENFIDIVDKEVYKVDIFDKQDYKYSAELEEKIKTYNHVLGGLSFTQYTLEGEYFNNYFSILAHFNNYIQSKINNRDDKYDGAFTHNGSFWSKLSPLLYECISDKDVLNFAKQEKVNIDKSNGIFKYETINDKSITYKLAILNTYGEDSTKRKKTNDLISDCKNEKIPKEKQEGIALIYGINNGYASFRNQYDKKIVKFKMDSLLNYYTIESVFQYVINDKKDNEKFDYIDRLFPNEKLVLDIAKESFDLEDLLNKFKNTLTEELQNKESELKDAKLKIEGLNRENHKKAEYLESLNKKVITKDDKLKEQESSLKKLINDKNQLNDKWTLLERDLKNKERELENEKLKVQELNSQNYEKSGQIESLKQTIISKRNEYQEELQNKESELKDTKLEIEGLNRENHKKAEYLESLNKKVITKDDKLKEQENSLKELTNDKNQLNDKWTLLEKDLKNKERELENEKLKVQELNREKSQEISTAKDNFDEEKERIIIEETLESYVEYDRKKVPELKKIAKEKGIKYTNKPDTIKLILAHKDNRLL